MSAAVAALGGHVVTVVLGILGHLYRCEPYLMTLGCLTAAYVATTRKIPAREARVQRKGFV